MKRTKNQHYVSQGILKHFICENQKIYELYIPKKIVSKKEIACTMSQNYLYEHTLLKENFLEESFANLESKVIPILDKLILDIEKKSCRFSDIAVKIKNLMPYLLVMYYRSGALIYEYSMCSEGYEVKDDRVIRMLNALDQKHILRLSKTIVKNYDMAILFDSKKRFLISDQYISTVALKYKCKIANISNRSIGLKDTMILIPLNSQIYIALFNGDIPSYIKPNLINYLGDSECQNINDIVFQNSYVKCVGAEEQELYRVADKNYDNLYFPGKTILKHSNGMISVHVTKREVYLYDIDKDLDTNINNYISDYIKKIKGKVHRNDICICGSKKKYKHCCLRKYERVAEIIRIYMAGSVDEFLVEEGGEIEKPILEFAGKEEKLKNTQDKEVLKKMKQHIPENMGFEVF